jgi:hypothetical protein
MSIDTICCCSIIIHASVTFIQTHTQIAIMSHDTSQVVHTCMQSMLHRTCVHVQHPAQTHTHSTKAYAATRRHPGRAQSAHRTASPIPWGAPPAHFHRRHHPPPAYPPWEASREALRAARGSCQWSVSGEERARTVLPPHTTPTCGSCCSCCGWPPTVACSSDI